MKKEKAFSNWRHNAIHLTFPNGNKLSTIWGYGSYSDNYEILDETNTIMDFQQWLSSDTCEIQIQKAPDKLVKKIHKKYIDRESGSVIGNLTMAEWLNVVKMLAK